MMTRQLSIVALMILAACAPPIEPPLAVDVDVELGQCTDRSTTEYDDVSIRSLPIPMRDGVRIAVDLRSAGSASRKRRRSFEGPGDYRDARCSSLRELDDRGQRLLRVPRRRRPVRPRTLRDRGPPARAPSCHIRRGPALHDVRPASFLSVERRGPDDPRRVCGDRDRPSPDISNGVCRSRECG